MEYDVCIIGAGIIGCILARELAKFHMHIIVVDKANDVSMGCTKANSGILHGGYDATHGTLKSKLVWRGNQLYTKCNEELNFGIDRCGSLVVAFDAEQSEKLSHLQHNGRLNGVLDTCIISTQALKEMEPNINDAACAALYCPHSGIVSPYEVAIAFAENAAHNGVDFLLRSPVTMLTYGKDAVESSKWHIQAGKHELSVKYVFNAAGVHADEIAVLAGHNRFSITPYKGNYYLFRRGYMPVQHVIFPTPTKKGKGILVSPTYHGNLLIGPDSSVVQDKDNTIPDEERLAYIIRQVLKTLPSLDIKQVIRSYAGIRPISDTKDFIIDAPMPGFYNLAGIASPGLTCAPAIAEYVIAMLKKQQVPLHKNTAFDPIRKAYIPRQKNRNFLDMKTIHTLSQLPEGDDKRYVCRCEQVPEKTIVHAMYQKPFGYSVDGIKRRTRASMGICQGKFCRPHIKRLLAAHLNTDMRYIED